MSSKMKACCSKLSQKWVFTVMGFLGMFVVFAIRMCLALTIPIMVKQIEHTDELQNDTCLSPNANFNNRTLKNATATKDQSETYEWSEYTQGIILSSFYWGFVVSHLMSGMIAERFGAKQTLGLGILFTSILTTCTPTAIKWGGSTALIIIRPIMGICEGTTQPAISVMLAQWVPANERSKISSFVFLGSPFGVLFISISLGTILRLMGWPGIYYISGGFGVIWYFLWFVLCYNNPREHPFISEEEAEYLNEQLREHAHTDVPPVPWKHLFKSKPFLALVIISIGHDWGGYTLMSDFPKYSMGVLKYTPDEIGLLFLVMNILVLISTSLFAWLSDWSLEKEYMSRTNVRKIMATIGTTVHGLMGVLASYVGCNKFQFFLLFCISAIMAGAGFPGIKANVLDLSPNYAGTVMAISHGLAGLCGIGGPYVAGILVTNQTLTEWRLVFWLILIMGVVSNIVFLLFASGEVQEWNDPNFERKKRKVDPENLQQTKRLLALTEIKNDSTTNDVKEN